MLTKFSNKPVKRALATIGTVGYSELTLNGTKAGDAQLSPEYTDYRKRVPYVMHDVTAAVTQGVNALGLSLANGFAATPGGGYLGWYGKAAPPRVLFRLRIEFTDGTSQTVTVNGAVYNAAVADTISPSVSLGKTRVGGSFGTSALTISRLTSP